MIKIADLMGALSKCVEAQRLLEECRQRATGDVDYYSYSYAQDLKRAEMAVEQVLNDLIDQRIAAKIVPRDLLHPVMVPAAVAAMA